MILLGIDLATLVQLAAIDAHIFVLGCHGSKDEFEGLGLNVVDLAESLEKDEGYGCGRRETSDGKGAFDDSAQTISEGIMFAKFQGCASKIVGPIVTFVARNVSNMKLSSFFELEGTKFYDSVLLGTICEMDAFVDSQACDFPKVSIAVSPNRTHSIGLQARVCRFL